jgi:hypothetical protein
LFYSRQKRLHAKPWQFATRVLQSDGLQVVYEILYTDVLDCGTWNLIEWSQVLYSYDCSMYVHVAGCMSARSYTIRYIMHDQAQAGVVTSDFQRRPV